MLLTVLLAGEKSVPEDLQCKDLPASVLSVLWTNASFTSPTTSWLSSHQSSDYKTSGRQLWHEEAKPCSSAKIAASTQRHNVEQDKVSYQVEKDLLQRDHRPYWQLAICPLLTFLWAKLPQYKSSLIVIGGKVEMRDGFVSYRLFFFSIAINHCYILEKTGYYRGQWVIATSPILSIVKYETAVRHRTDWAENDCCVQWRVDWWHLSGTKELCQYTDIT